MHIPTLSTKQWVIILATFLLVTIGIAFIATTNPIDGMNAQQDIVTPIPTPVVSKPIPAPTASYKIIPRNSTYIPSKPPVEPVDANRTYLITINPPFDKRDVIIRQGTIFEVSGTTDLPVGSGLRVGLFDGASRPSLKERPQSGNIDTIDDGSTTGRWGAGGICYVESSCVNTTKCVSPFNTWRFICDSQMILPNEYIITVDSRETNGSNNTLVNILEP
jgi:hypothetical protein